MHRVREVVWISAGMLFGGYLLVQALEQLHVYWHVSAMMGK